MQPILWQKGPIVLHSYGLLVATGFLAALSLASQHAKHYGFSKQQISDLMFWALFSGLIGARVLYVLSHWSLYAQRPWEVFYIHQGGLVFYGGFLTAVAVLYAQLRRQKISISSFSDFIIPYLPLAHAFGRVGCYFNGCCYGGTLIASQILAAMLNTLWFVVLLFCRSRGILKGRLWALYAVLYGSGRFAIERLRTDVVTMFGPFRISQVISLAMIALGLYFLLKTKKESA